ncbi:hypothetical protein RRG08_065728 [Elysia crispata]|uniref:Uncharacterized protein n=1 Tax=Elysia crispata TaxID=231223 RepID=A0AAE0Z6K2_9GAST|nr:hypothetical protein RRG08_065728 [Elysia crispata]
MRNGDKSSQSMASSEDMPKAAPQRRGGQFPSQQYPSPDGGYGYMVALSSSMITFLNDGVGNSFGILLPHLLEDLQASVTLASIAPGLRMAMFMFIGGC